MCPVFALWMIREGRTIIERNNQPGIRDSASSCGKGGLQTHGGSVGTRSSLAWRLGVSVICLGGVFVILTAVELIRGALLLLIGSVLCLGLIIGFIVQRSLVANVVISSCVITAYGIIAYRVHWVTHSQEGTVSLRLWSPRCIEEIDEVGWSILVTLGIVSLVFGIIGVFVGQGLRGGRTMRT